jgi:hypothetical protein
MRRDALTFVPQKNPIELRLTDPVDAVRQERYCFSDGACSSALADTDPLNCLSKCQIPHRLVRPGFIWFPMASPFRLSRGMPVASPIVNERPI